MTSAIATWQSAANAIAISAQRFEIPFPCLTAAVPASKRPEMKTLELSDLIAQGPVATEVVDGHLYAVGGGDELHPAMLAAARAAGGQERDTLMKELSADYYIGGANLITLWQMPTIFGASQALQWSQPQVGWLRPDQMSLSE